MCKTARKGQNEEFAEREKRKDTKMRKANIAAL